MDIVLTISGWVAAVIMAVMWYFLYFRALGPEVIDSNEAKHAFYRFKAQHFETTFSACPDAIFITNDQGIITYVNNVSESIFGYSTQELLGNNVDLLMPSHIAKFHHQYLLDFHLTGKTGTIGRRREIICKRSDGSEFPAELSLGATKEGNKYVFIGIITDISERKAIEAKHRKSEQLRTVLTNSTEGIMLLFTPDGVCKLANKAAINSIGKPEEQIIGANITEFLDSESAKRRLHHITETASTQRSLSVRDHRNDQVFENNYTPIFDEKGNVSEVAIHAINITERLRYEATLEKAKQQAEEANESKTLFISKVSHELKNPLNSILGFAHIIQDELQTKPSKIVEHSELNEHKDAIDTIIKSGSHILDLINDLLDISSAELDALPINIQEVDACATIDEVAQMMQPIAHSKHITIERTPCSGNYTVKADPQRLKQVITNLISNAIKYNQESGHVTVSCQASPEHNIIISVSDTGIGIPKTEQDNVFKVFNRASNGKSTTGNGLGLHLCKQLIEQMDGRIHFESIENKGSRFWLELPLSRLTPMNDLSEQSASNANLYSKTKFTQISNNQEMTLLVIEDNPSNLRLLEKVTRKIEGYHFYQAENLKRGRQLLHELTPDVLILDLNLPDGKGVDMLEELTNIPHVIVLSAFTTEEQYPELYNKGASLVLKKPMNIRQVTEALEEWKRNKAFHNEAATLSA
jgi:PAS domain S-box-containing protein